MSAELRSWDPERFYVAVQSLEDHAFTVLEAHAEVPPSLLDEVRRAAYALDQLLSTLSRTEGEKP